MATHSFQKVSKFSRVKSTYSVQSKFCMQAVICVLVWQLASSRPIRTEDPSLQERIFGQSFHSTNKVLSNGDQQNFYVLQVESADNRTLSESRKSSVFDPREISKIKFDGKIRKKRSNRWPYKETPSDQTFIFNNLGNSWPDVDIHGRNSGDRLDSNSWGNIVKQLKASTRATPQNRVTIPTKASSTLSSTEALFDPSHRSSITFLPLDISSENKVTTSTSIGITTGPSYEGYLGAVKLIKGLTQSPVSDRRASKSRDAEKLSYDPIFMNLERSVDYSEVDDKQGDNSKKFDKTETQDISSMSNSRDIVPVTIPKISSVSPSVVVQLSSTEQSVLSSTSSSPEFQTTNSLALVGKSFYSSASSNYIFRHIPRSVKSLDGGLDYTDSSSTTETSVQPIVIRNPLPTVAYFSKTERTAPATTPNSTSTKNNITWDKSGTTISLQPTGNSQDSTHPVTLSLELVESEAELFQTSSTSEETTLISDSPVVGSQVKKEVIAQAGAGGIATTIVSLCAGILILSIGAYFVWKLAKKRPSEDQTQAVQPRSAIFR